MANSARKIGKIFMKSPVWTLALLCVCFPAALSDGIPNCPVGCVCRGEYMGERSARCTFLDKSQRFDPGIIRVHIPQSRMNTLDADIFAKSGLTNVQSVAITDGTLTNVSERAFRNLSKLYDVDLSNNQLILIGADTFGQAPNLHKLNLAGNPLQLTQVLAPQRDYFLKSNSLTELDMSRCQFLRLLPHTFTQVKNLIFLNLSGNVLHEVPKEAFTPLEKLEELDFSGNKLVRVDKNAFVANKELASLKLMRNPLEMFNGLNIPSLEELDLGDCKLRVLMKECLDGMPELLTLNLSGNSIEIVSPDAFDGLPQLRHLDLSRNKLVGPLPRAIFAGTNDLATLSLADNPDLKILVEGTFANDLTSLQKLDLSSCRMDGVQLKGMTSLTELYLADNDLLDVDGAFTGLKKLRILDISNNGIRTLPLDAFAANEALLHLKLSGNPLTELPVQAFDFTPNLIYLEARGCSLKKVWGRHKELLKKDNVLANLKTLNLADNRIGMAHPYDFASMRSLEHVDLSGNVFKCVKTSIQMVEWFASKKISPQRNNQPSKWNDFVDEICPPRATDDILPEEEKGQASSLEHDSWFSCNIYGGDYGAVVVNLLVGMAGIITGIMIIMLIRQMYWHLHSNYYERKHNNQAHLGGQMRMRGASGMPMYYKLYEECSVPAQDGGKSNIVMSPIHSILGKGNNYYKIMKNDEAHV